MRPPTGEQGSGVPGRWLIDIPARCEHRTRRRGRGQGAVAHGERGRLGCPELPGLPRGWPCDVSCPRPVRRPGRGAAAAARCELVPLRVCPGGASVHGAGATLPAGRSRGQDGGYAPWLIRSAYRSGIAVRVNAGCGVALTARAGRARETRGRGPGRDTSSTWASSRTSSITDGSVVVEPSSSRLDTPRCRVLVLTACTGHHQEQGAGRREFVNGTSRSLCRCLLPAACCRSVQGLAPPDQSDFDQSVRALKSLSRKPCRGSMRRSSDGASWCAVTCAVSRSVIRSSTQANARPAAHSRRGRVFQ